VHQITINTQISPECAPRSEGTIVPPGPPVLGTPGRVVRETTDAQRADIRRSAEHYVAMIGTHRGAGGTP